MKRYVWEDKFNLTERIGEVPLNSLKQAMQDLFELKEDKLCRLIDKYFVDYDSKTDEGSFSSRGFLRYVHEKAFETFCSYETDRNNELADKVLEDTNYRK